MRTLRRCLAALALLIGLGWSPLPAIAATAPGISVAPQAGAPGTTFAVLGAGFAPKSLVAVTVMRAGVTVTSVAAVADGTGSFALALDSNGYQESADYRVDVGGAIPVSTPFAVATSQPERCFLGETGFCTRGRFLAYWETHGGLALNGYPLSTEINEILEDGKPYAVQYFERTRLEYHPEEPDPAAQVLVGQFGRRLHPLDPKAVPDPLQIWFPQTGHNVPNDFYRYWSEHGGLAQFGLPLTDAYSQRLEDGNVYRVQYFERARFESHPENLPPYTLLLGQFGRMILAEARR